MIDKKKYYEALKSINFSDRFKELYADYPYTDNYMHSIKKVEILNILNKTDYRFNFLDKAYVLVEEFGEIKIQFVLNVHGNVLAYIYIWYREELLDVINGHFAHIRNYIDGIEEYIAPTFKNHLELAVIIKCYLSIYNDFKLQILK